jgi:hypothetical protein
LLLLLLLLLASLSAAPAVAAVVVAVVAAVKAVVVAVDVGVVTEAIRIVTGIGMMRWTGAMIPAVPVRTACASG